MEPLTHYDCTAEYDYFNKTVKGETKTVFIKCDVNNTPELSATNTSIIASWDTTSSNCGNQTFDWNVKCNGTYKKLDQKQNPYNSSGLKPFENYSCTFTALYKNASFLSTLENIRTHPGAPEIKNCTTAKINNNAFGVTCTIVKWNGKSDGAKLYAQLYIGNAPCTNHSATCKESVCSIIFSNLYYLTAYTVKVYAINGNNNSTDKVEHHSTSYNDTAVLGFLGFLIVLTSLALLFVMYKIYLLRKDTTRDDCEMDLLPQNTLLQVEPISAEALVDTYKRKRADEGRLFMEEFQSIPRIFSNYSVKEAKRAENQTKNRYIDILPYDYNRVQLSHEGHDYINASFIEGYKESNKYIAAQGPKEETIGDFWAMIWEQKSSIIVMVTRCEEGNKNKCAQYWPSLGREAEIFDDMVVKIKREENCPNYIIRHLTLINRKEKSQERQVTQIQFTSWPDHGVPSDPGLLLKLRRRVNSFKNVFSGPIVTHCSAGVGRTGTYISIDAMIESLEAEGRVDIYGYVAKLRRQRCLMVQVEAQYVLIHTALIEYNQFGETEISLSDFHSVVNTLKQEANEPSLMELEFQRLPKFSNYRASNTAQSEENNKKNRYSSVVPYDFNRVLIKLEEDSGNESQAEDDEEYSSDEDDELPTKYINASYVDGYWVPDSLITAQGPMADTVGDFLHMLYQMRVKVVFMLSDCTENDKECCSSYCPNEKTTFDEIEVEVIETETFPTYIRRQLKLNHTKRDKSHTVDQYQFLKWASHEVPANPLDLIDMMKSIRQSYYSISANKRIPIVVHCGDGSSRSGIFCALWKLMDSAETEKLVDIFQVAKDLRKTRPGMVTNFEQYKFLYTALELALPVQNGEVKKASAATDNVEVIDESEALIGSNGADHSTKTDTMTESETETKTGDEASTASASPDEGASESSNMPEKGPSEGTTNGPNVTVEV
ncbi:receptor-type tyrosine-protein phosphatase C [Trichomycterus rosablanca]|uniref:receptor-type tyrosine-protein phosphatase C n=1 Tax=Trichomycterus rosablanca TaxID=2290929 RepID=UPI002F35A996